MNGNVPACQCVSPWFGTTCAEITCPGGCNEPYGTCSGATGVPFCECFSNATISFYGPNCASSTTGCPPDCQPPWGQCSGATCNCSSVDLSGASCRSFSCPQNCNGNGVCVFNTTTNMSECSCQSGWEGISCGAKPATSAPQAGTACAQTCIHGTCDTSGLAPTCQCDVGWSGANCATELSSSSSSLSAGAIAGIAVGVTVLIALAFGVGIGVFTILRRQRVTTQMQKELAQEMNMNVLANQETLSH